MPNDTLDLIVYKHDLNNPRQKSLFTLLKRRFSKNPEWRYNLVHKVDNEKAILKEVKDFENFILEARVNLRNIQEKKFPEIMIYNRCPTLIGGYIEAKLSEEEFRKLMAQVNFVDYFHV